MSDNGFRIVGLNAVLVIAVGMFIGGFPLVWVIVREVYGQPAPMTLGGDYRGWLMAHLEGLLNGLLAIGVAAATRMSPKGPAMSATRERVLVWSLLVGAWGNTLASVIAPLLGVRGMAFNGAPGNNLVAGLFAVALAATTTALVIASLHLARRPAA